jgi:hypothetical protein
VKTMKAKVKETAISLLLNFWLIPFAGIIVLLATLTK